MHAKQYDIIFKNQILSYLKRPVSTRGDSSLALGMTWQLGGYWGEEVAIPKTVLSKADLQRTFFKFNRICDI